MKVNFKTFDIHFLRKDSLVENKLNNHMVSEEIEKITKGLTTHTQKIKS